MEKIEIHQQAWQILDELKSRIIKVLWEDDKYKYNTEHFILPWLQEDAEYAIKKLPLNEKDEEYYLYKVEQIMGEYLEEA
ncbi:MAG: hypothetical protein R6U04_07355 [Bacteroidales bacterium]